MDTLYRLNNLNKKNGACSIDPDYPDITLFLTNRAGKLLGRVTAITVRALLQIIPHEKMENS